MRGGAKKCLKEAEGRGGRFWKLRQMVNRGILGKARRNMSPLLPSKPRHGRDGNGMKKKGGGRKASTLGLGHHPMLLKQAEAKQLLTYSHPLLPVCLNILNFIRINCECCIVANLIVLIFC